MESPALLQRFRAERQILATLTHPNIGAILDGGDTEDRRPYIVMEYVEGQPITHASETRGWSIRQRIELFRSLCSAVQYAHQKLVIHRDIKPSNVLVTSDGIVKLIDFGISKPLAPELIPGDLTPTEGGQRLLTPDYASPEQLLGRLLTTATDIYSLGVLLFELLTGARPYTLSDLSPGAAERIVCEQASRKPSSVPEISRQARRELAGDLDTIVLKAMDKDPSRRYGSAEELDQDLLRFLEGKPILAQKATLLYRANKFVKRHKTASLIASVACAAVGSSILFFSMQSHAADAREKRVEGLADFAVSDMAEKLQNSSASVELQASLFHTTLNYLNQLRQDSSNDPRLLLKLSKAYGRVGTIEGSPFVASRGDIGNAVTSYQEALRTALLAHSRLPGEDSTRALIEAYEQLGQIESFSGNLKEARDHCERCLPIAREFNHERPDDPIRKQLLAANYAGLGYVQLNSLETDKAVQSIRNAIEVLGNVPNGSEDHDRTLLVFCGRLGTALNELGSNAEAIRSYEKAIVIADDVVRRFPSQRAKRDVYALCNNIVGPLAGRETLNAGESDKAQVYARKAVAIAEELAASDPSNMQARYDLGYAFTKMGDSLFSTKPDVAAAWYRKSIAVTTGLGPRTEAQRELAERDETLASVLISRAEAPERLRLVREANTIRQEMANAGPNPPLDRVHLMRSYCRLSDAELATNDVAEATRFAAASLPFFDEFKVTSPSLVVLRDLGFCYESLGNAQRAVANSRSSSRDERHAAETEAREWYQKSADVWNEWVNRSVATPESEVERRKVERLLRAQ
jgi:serine/threonine protein kinase